jgi:hypothetical protein
MRNPTRNEQSTTSDVASICRVGDLKRRRFLFTLGVGSAGAAAVVAGAMPVAAAAPPAAPEADAESGYRETGHVRDYYRSAKI